MIPEALLNKAMNFGTDDQFQAYVRQWPSVLTNNFKEWVNGDGRSVFAHHREVGAGAGIALKPMFCGYPLTQEQHVNTHNHGLSYYNPIEWWRSKAIEMLTRWINNVSPPVLPEKRTKETYVIVSENHMRAFQEMLATYFANPKAKAVEVVIQTGKKRSLKQNSSLWGVVYGDLLEFYKENGEALAKDVVEYVINHNPSVDFIHEMMKGLCNKAESTAKLKTQEHSNYFDRISYRFQDKYGHEVKMPVNNDGNYSFY